MSEASTFADTGYREKGHDNYDSYRSISKSAVLSIIAAFLSLLGLLAAPLTVFGLAALGSGLIALGQIKRFPNELTGRPLAIAGAVCGVLLFVGGAANHTYIYMTEVPEGYDRVTFAQLQPTSKRDLAQIAQAYHGKKIFIKGYVHPGVDGRANIENFVLVRDMGTCCFGGQPELTDMIEVKLVDPLRTAYNTRRRKLAGTFYVTPNPEPAPGGLQGGYYKIVGEKLK